MEYLLIPYPVSITEKGGFICGKPYCAPMEGNADIRLCKAAEMIGNEGDILVSFVKDDGKYSEYTQSPEGYAIDIEKDAISITAASVEGWFYGAVTLLQLQRQFKNELPCLLIVDKPVWNHRGAQISYAQVNVDYREEYIRRFLKKMAMIKVNHVYLYLEWRFWFNSIPSSHMPGYITPQDVKNIIKIAAAYNITIIPQLNLLGHTGEFLAAECFNSLKEYKQDTGDSLVGESSALCPTNPATRALIEKALGDIIDAFDSEIIHVGGDEVSLLGECPLCAPIAKEKGRDMLYVEFFVWISEFLKKRNKKMGIWGDMLTHYAGINPYEQAEKGVTIDSFLPLRDNTVIFDWSYDGPSRESVEGFVQNGFEVICSTSVHGASVAAPWLGQVKNQRDFFVDGQAVGAGGGLVTDWIYTYGYHGEEMGALYSVAEAIMWQGADEKAAKGVSLEQLEKAIALQYYGAPSELAELWHQAGDPDKTLKFFKDGKNGSYLRKAAYLSDNPLRFYLRYAPSLRGHFDEFKEECKKLEDLYAKVEAAVLPEEREWIGFQKCSLILYRYLSAKYQWAEEFHKSYRTAALAQYENSELFKSELLKAAEGLEKYHECFKEPKEFLEMCREKLGMEQGSIYRINSAEAKLKRLAEFAKSLADSHRPLPAIHNLEEWLFDRPLAAFSAARNDEWYNEPEEYRLYENDSGTEWGSARW